MAAAAVVAAVVVAARGGGGVALGAVAGGVMWGAVDVAEIAEVK